MSMKICVSFLLLLFLLVSVAFWISTFLRMDFREGWVKRVGIGEGRRWTADGISGGLRQERMPSGCMLNAMEPAGDSRMSFLLVHDVSEHIGNFAVTAVSIFNQCEKEGFSCAVYGIDLPGHGRSETRGEFTMQEMIASVGEAASWIKNTTRDGAVFLVGKGIGGEVAFQAGSVFEEVTGMVVNGVLLPSEMKHRPQIEYVKGIVGEILQVLFGDAKLSLAAFISFERQFDRIDCGAAGACAWHHDREMYEDNLRDPLSLWAATFSSLRSLFTYKPVKSSLENETPILLLAGGQDKVIPLASVRSVFERIGGPKLLRIDMEAGHQVLQQHHKQAARLIVAWSAAVLDGKLSTLMPESPYLNL
mmetsp:Transcript_44895/g.141350  ORF Transcript_44895/g.141350 Transcript_44895/m.141350 type:complete len:362 (-) Transcript_44895:170-1255(-)